MIFYIKYLCLTDVFISIITLKFLSKQIETCKDIQLLLQIIGYEYFTIN